MAFGSEQWMYASGGFYPHEIGNSARFDTNSYLTRTPSSAGNRKTWTWSGWVKLGAIGAQSIPISAYGGSTYTRVLFATSNVGNITIQNIVSNTAQCSVNTVALFRDPSAWYHVVIAMDTTQAASADRIKIYVNGVDQELTTTTAVTLNSDTLMNSTTAHYLGAQLAGNSHYNGYMAEINFIDGQALDATDFGETKSGVWIPKRYSGTYGTNGYYLPFNDAGFLGKDASTVLGSEIVINGNFDTNINNWTAHNGATLALSNNRLSVYESPGADGGAYQAISVESGKTYSIEATVDIGTTAGARVGIEYTLGGRDGVETPSNQGGHFQFTFTPSSTGTVYVRCFIQAPGTAYFDNISVKEITTQGNDFTSTNVLVTDQMLDSPTNNFCTSNPLSGKQFNNNLITYSEGNLKGVNPAAVSTNGASTFGIPSTGKYYFEFLAGTRTADMWIGAQSENGFTGNGTGYRHDGGISFNGSSAVAGAYATFTTGDIIGVALDMSGNTATYYKNGTQVATGTRGVATKTYTTWTQLNNTGDSFSLNFGQDSSFAGTKTRQGNTDANGIGDFYYAPPADYLALCSANLPDPAIDPAEDDIPADYFNPVTYTGTGSAANVDVGFQPDWIWFKQRSGTNNHQLYDSVRGADLALFSNTTSDEYDYSQHPSGDLSPSFTSNGFQTPSVVNAGINTSGSTYVAWNWKAGGTAVANTDGTITSTVSANTDAGFSVVTYTGTNTNGATVGHGLSEAPQFIITKDRDVAQAWYVWSHSLATATTGLGFDTSAAAAFSYGNWGAKTSTTIETVAGGNGMANVSTNGSDYVAYCFHSVEGFSKFGTYTGNGSTDGPFVYTGFRPAFLMVKRTEVANNHWPIWDSARNDSNAAESNLWADRNAAENTTDVYALDFTSNGFKIRNTHGQRNASGGNYIYMAFAEMPFKYANAR